MNHSSDRRARSCTAAAPAVIVLVLLVTTAALPIGCRASKVPDSKVLKVAHRGGAGLAPENTLAAFGMGLAYEADMLELDIHMSRDGVLMVMHDSLLERTTGQPGEIIDYDAAVLGTFDAAATYGKDHRFGFQKIPTLEEVLDFIDAQTSRPVGLQIEIKLKNDGSRYRGIEEELIRILRERNRVGSTIAISFDFPSLATVARIEPDLKRGALIGKTYMTAIGAGGPKAVADDMASLGVDYVGINCSYLSQTLYKEFKARNLGVGVWIVNDPEAIKRFAGMGVDFVTSDRPNMLRTTLM